MTISNTFQFYFPKNHLVPGFGARNPNLRVISTPSCYGVIAAKRFTANRGSSAQPASSHAAPGSDFARRGGNSIHSVHDGLCPPSKPHVGNDKGRAKPQHKGWYQQHPVGRSNRKKDMANKGGKGKGKGIVATNTCYKCGNPCRIARDCRAAAYNFGEATS